MRCVPTVDGNLKKSQWFSLGDCSMLELTSCDTETSPEIVNDSPDEGGCLERSPDGSNETVNRDGDDQCDVEPVDMFVPVGPGNRLVGDMRFPAGHHFLVTSTLRGRRHGHLHLWSGLSVLRGSCHDD
jgi:hypothetical protein